MDKEKLAAMLPPVTEETPSFKDIYVKNVTCKGAGRAAFMQGLPEMNLKNIQLTNITISATKGIEMIDADGIVLTNVNITTEKGYALQMKNSKRVTIDKFKYQVPQEVAVKMEGQLLESIQFTKSDFKDAAKQISISEEVDKKAVRIK